MKPPFTATLRTTSLIALAPAVQAQSIDIGPGGVRLDPRTPREREDDAIRREERRRDFEDGSPPRRDRY